MKVYSNMMPGDETTPVVPDKLTSEEKEVRSTIRSLEEQIAVGEKARIQLKALRASCKHFKFKDSPGFPYDTRTCAVCGESMGAV